MNQHHINEALLIVYEYQHSNEYNFETHHNLKFQLKREESRLMMKHRDTNQKKSRHVTRDDIPS